MKIYTKNGDGGNTSIIGQRCVSKHDERIDAYGTVDELNTYLGLVRSFSIVQKTIYNDFIIELQKKLFKLGSYLAQSDYKSVISKKFLIKQSDIIDIENYIDDISKKLPVLKSFVLNGGEIISSHIQISRTICRRAERKLTMVNEKYDIHSIWLIFINRLSDFLFVLGRHFLHISGEKELYWKGI